MYRRDVVLLLMNAQNPPATHHIYAADTSERQPKTDLATRRSLSQRSVQGTNTLRNRFVWLRVLSLFPKLEMWANAQCDGRPAEYRWRPLFNAAKFG